PEGVSVCAGLLYLMMAWGDKHWKSDIGGAPWRKCSMQHPAPWCFLAHSLATLGRWGCGEHYLHTQTHTNKHNETHREEKQDGRTTAQKATKNLYI
ncbi:hypothetical protein D3Y67_32775, partial [Escherichia coli]